MTLEIGLRHLHAVNAWCKRLLDSGQQIEGIGVRIKHSMAEHGANDRVREENPSALRIEDRQGRK